MPAAILARFVLLEARRGGLPWLAVASLAIALGLAAFLSQVALTGSLALQASIVAALLLWASAGTVALWALSLACETVLVAAAALFFSMTLAQLVPAIAATAGLYVLARSMAAIQSIAGGPLAEAP